jgi:exosome complex RNA-binding protein Csl4
VTGRVAPSAQQQQQQHQSGGLSDKNAVTGIGRAFQPSDVVACRIVSVSSGDQRCYDLSTTEAELGVLQATCHHCKAARLVPKTWREMICSDCGHAEPRKVAKPWSVVGSGQQLPAVE